MLYNPRPLNNKIVQVMTYMQDKQIDVAGICESWLTGANTPTTATIKQFGYEIIHSFREDQMGGGTALLYKANLSFSPASFSKSYKTFES